MTTFEKKSQIADRKMGGGRGGRGVVNRKFSVLIFNDFPKPPLTKTDELKKPTMSPSKYCLTTTGVHFALHLKHKKHLGAFL